jgi:hypothetical protein
MFNGPKYCRFNCMSNNPPPQSKLTILTKINSNTVTWTFSFAFVSFWLQRDNVTYYRCRNDSKWPLMIATFCSKQIRFFRGIIFVYIEDIQHWRTNTRICNIFKVKRTGITSNSHGIISIFIFNSSYQKFNEIPNISAFFSVWSNLK